MTQDSAGFEQLPTECEDSDALDDDPSEIQEEEEEDDDVKEFVMTRRIRTGLAEVYTCWNRFLSDISEDIVYIPLPAEVR